MNPILLLAGWKVKIKAIYKTHIFRKKALVDSTTTFGANARCTNPTNDQSKIKIGRYCDIDATLSVQDKGKITVGDYTTIRYNSLVGAAVNIRIGTHVIISNNVHIYDNNNHPVSPKKRWEMCESGFYGEKWQWKNSTCKPVIIEDNVWIGERSTILKGVTIGYGSVIGCDSVVTHDVPPYCVVAGNPAKVVKEIKE